MSREEAAVIGVRGYEAGMSKAQSSLGRETKSNITSPTKEGEKEYPGLELIIRVVKKMVRT